MRTSRLGLAIFLAGSALFVLSLVWPSLVGGRRVWTEQQARRHAEVMAKVHQLSYAHGRGRQGVADGGLEAARRDYRRGLVALETARTRGRRTAVICRYVGLAGAVIGGCLFLAGRRET